MQNLLKIKKGHADGMLKRKFLAVDFKESKIIFALGMQKSVSAERCARDGSVRFSVHGVYIHHVLTH